VTAGRLRYFLARVALSPSVCRAETPSPPARPGSRRWRAQHRRHVLGCAARSWLVGTLTCAALLAIGSTAVAQAGWSEPLTLEHPVTAAAGNAQGAEAFMWQVTTPATLNPGASPLKVSYVQARIRLPDGKLTPPQSISRTNEVAVRPRAIGLDERGTATAVWTQATQAAPSRVAIMVAVRPPGGRFGRPVEVGRARFGNDVKLAVAADGAAVIVWSRMNLIQAVHRPATRCATGSARACFGPVQTIPGDCPGGAINCRDTRVAFGPDRAYLTWSAIARRGEAFRDVVRLAIRSERRGFGARRMISGKGSAWQPSISVLPDGTLVLAWLGEPANGGARITVTMRDPNGRRVSAPQTVFAVPATEGCYRPQVSANRQGEVTLVWQCNPESLPAGFSAGRIAASVRPPGGARRTPFGPAMEIAPADSHAGAPSLAVDSGGNTILVYSDGGRILARVRRPGQGFEAPVLVGTGRPSQVLGAGDKATVAWRGPRPNTTMLSDWKP
jgi:hypothetical protein